jgi:hypothetical protein
MYDNQENNFGEEKNNDVSNNSELIEIEMCIKNQNEEKKKNEILNEKKLLEAQ